MDSLDKTLKLNMTKTCSVSFTGLRIRESGVRIPPGAPISKKGLGHYGLALFLLADLAIILPETDV